MHCWRGLWANDVHMERILDMLRGFCFIPVYSLNYWIITKIRGQATDWFVRDVLRQSILFNKSGKVV